MIDWTEEGSSPFADDLYDVFVTVRERIPANNRSSEGDDNG